MTPRGHDAISGKFLLDTASDGAVTLFSPVVREHRLAGPAPTMPAGASGEMQAISRGESLTLGGFLLREPLIALSVSGSGMLADAAHAGLIGMEVLRRFTVTLDYARGRIFLEKNATFNSTFDHDASGLRVQPQGEDLTTLEVRRVLPGSPGAEAGFQNGDVILSVDGRPVRGDHAARSAASLSERREGVLALDPAARRDPQAPDQVPADDLVRREF